MLVGIVLSLTGVLPHEHANSHRAALKEMTIVASVTLAVTALRYYLAFWFN